MTDQTNSSQETKPATKTAEKSVKSEPKEAPKDSNKKGIAPAANSVGLKYRLLFLADQLFRGKSYRKGDEIEVSAPLYAAYKGRSTLKFEQKSTH